MKSKNSKKFIMRTLLQKLNASAAILPMLLVGLFSITSFGQTCDVVAVDCNINGCPETPEVFIADAACSYVYTLPALTGSGACVGTNYEVRLAEYSLFQYNNPPSTTAVGTIASTNGTGTGNTVTFNEPGTYVLLWHLFDLDNNDGQPDACCTSEVELKVANSIACNDQVQVTMDGECMATITLDMILEGENGACDYSSQYLMSIDGVAEDQTEIVIDTPGEYTVSVVTPTGEQCWGSILVEDKISALLTNCQDFDIFCNQTYEPGDPILDHHVVPQAVDANGTPVYVDYPGGIATPINAVIVPATTTVPSVIDPTVDSLVIGTDTIFFDLTTVGTNQTVQSFEQIALSIDAPSINTIEAFLEAPDGTQVQLLDLVSGNFCTESGLDLILSDDAFRSHNILVSPSNCGLGANHAYCGDYQPFEALSTFNGSGINGMWALIVINHSENDDAAITGGSLSLIGDDGNVPYPFDGTVTETGDAEYTIAIPNNNCGPYTASYEDEETGECAPGISNTIVRTWTVVSASSGVESTCSQTITIKTWMLGEDENTTQLVLPPDHDGNDSAPFFCSQFFDGNGSLITNMLTAEGAPLPSVTGTIEAPFGDIGLCGNYAFTYEDQILPICGNFAKKIVRNWTGLDWCTGEILTHPQIIKVIDNDPPIIVCVPDSPTEDFDPSMGVAGSYFLYTDNGFTCSADWDVRPPLQVFDCGSQLDGEDYPFEIAYLVADEDGLPPVDGEYITDNVVYENGVPVTITDLPQGQTWIQYTVVDDCGNSSQCLTEVTVLDDDVPNPVCVEFLVLSLGSDGCAHAGAESFDKGSWDNCGISHFEVRRLDINDDFGPYVDYCCTDLTEDQKLVELKVVDLDGNENTCIVEVELQNPFGIIWDSTADPVYNFDCEDDMPTCDTYMSLFSASHNLEDCPLTITCDGPRLVSEIDDCGNGSYEIIYTASNGLTDDINYTVRLNFSNEDPFDPENDVNWSALTNGTINGCPDEVTLDPANVGSPSVNDTPCGLIAMTYEDQIFDDVENACMKVLRTWTVIDWCTYDTNNPTENVAEFVQVIKINDIDLPVLNCNPPSTTIEGTENSCNLNTTPLDTDEILILDETEGFDECSESLDRDYDVEYEIDYDRDGSVDAQGTGRNANGVHDYGQHSITWTITDHCGNVNSCSYNFEIRDNKPPTPYCLGEVVVVTMPEGTGAAEIWATDFDLGSEDNVTGQCNDRDLLFSLTNVLTGETGTSLSFDCDDMPNGDSQDILLQMWVTDEFGNADYCEVTVLFQDNANDACDGGNSREISGNIYTENNEMLEEAMVQIASTVEGYNTQMMTQGDGAYLFMAPQNNDYNITSEKEDDALNGVSTLDLVLIQKHILNSKLLDSPYKIIAADANKNGSVSAVDLITIRKVILGLNDGFPNDEMPWRFVDADQTWTDDMNPFPYSEKITISDHDQDMPNNNFIAVKIGDVNSTVVVNGFVDAPVSERTASTLELVVDNNEFTVGENVSIPVTAANFNNIAGAQFTMSFNADIVEFDGVTPGAMAVTDANFGYRYLAEGYVTASWNDVKALSAESNEVLFTINFIATATSNVSNVLSINSDITRAEAYTDELESMDVQLTVNGQVEGEGYALYQNIPNPFGSETTISFRTPVDGPVSLTIYDVNGKLVKKISENFNKGTNSIVLNAEDLQAKGIFYYQMEAAGYSATKKMIVVE